MKKGVFIFWSVFIVVAIVRVVFSLYQNVPSIGDCLKHKVEGFGVVTADPERKEGGQIFIVSTDRVYLATTSKSLNGPVEEKLCGSNISIRVKSKLYPRFKYGDQVTFTGKISQPLNFKSDTGRAFDYKGFLAKDDVFFEIKSAVVEIVAPQTRKKSFLNKTKDKISSVLFSIKRRFVSNLEHSLGEPHSALAAGLVVGEKSALGKDLLNDFRIVGLIHIVVLSGFNITVVGDAMRRMLSFLPRVWGISVGGIGIVLFGVMVGGGATVVRSCFMAGIALSADLIRRDYSVMRALVFAGLIMVIQNPMILLHDPSFQLSFLATLGLVLLASPLEKKLVFITEKFGIRGIVASTIATQFFLSPFLLYMMGQISIIGMVANILVLPLIPLTMLVVFLTGVVGFISLAGAQLFGWVSYFLLSYELHLVEWFARLPYASVTLPIFSGWWVVGFYVVFGLGYWWVSARSVKSKTSAPTLQEIFEKFQKIPKGVLIDDPDGLVDTNFIFNKAFLESLDCSKREVFFTRRTLKHVAEKGIEGAGLFELINNVFQIPERIYFSNSSNRFLIVKRVTNQKEGRFHVVVVEHKSIGFIMITMFVAQQKYLKNFKILWRTAASSK